MNGNVKRFTVVAALVASTAFAQEGSAQAQTGWGNFQIHTGWMNPATLAESDDGVIIDGVFFDTGARLGLDEGFGIGAGFDFWFGGSRIWGLSLEGTYKGWNGWDTRFDDDFDFDADFDLGHDVALWQYDASLNLRLAKPTANTRILPWLSMGIGGVTINPENDFTLFSEAVCVQPLDVNGTVCDFDAVDVELDLDSRSEVAFVPALGVDFFMSPSVALRLELKDYWTDDSPYFRLSDGLAHDGGHNILINGGLAFYWGGRRVVEPGFVREEPIIVPPPPPPAPPADVRSTMCVVDPNGYQVRTIETVMVPSEQRVYVMRNGQRVPVEAAYPASAPIYVRGATWYMNDQPLTVSLETGTVNVPADQRNRLELVRFGSTGTRSANDLVFIGTINGTPIFANRADVTSFRSRLEQKLSTSNDLGTILRTDADLAREMGQVDTYYVAVEPNCVFQPMSVTHFVRRTRG
jgi:opacity protein-like surface antigen